MQKYYAIVENVSWTADIDGYPNQESHAIIRGIADNKEDAKRLVQKLEALKAHQIAEEAKEDPHIDSQHPFSLTMYKGDGRWGYKISVNDDGDDITTDTEIDIYYETFNANELKKES